MLLHAVLEPFLIAFASFENATPNSSVKRTGLRPAAYFESQAVKNIHWHGVCHQSSQADCRYGGLDLVS